MQFIRLRPTAVLIGEDGTVDVIRREETIDDVKDAERLPERLAPAAGPLAQGGSPRAGR
jgi:diaminopimelate decarboxylase